MKTGYELYIQDDLNEEQKKRAIDFLNEFHTATQADPKKRYFAAPSGGYTSYCRRGTYGFSIDWGKSDLVFRRIAKNARRFAVVQKQCLKVLGEPGGCVCPDHLGGAKVEWIQKPAMTLFLSVGNTKG